MWFKSVRNLMSQSLDVHKNKLYKNHMRKCHCRILAKVYLYFLDYNRKIKYNGIESEDVR